MDLHVFPIPIPPPGLPKIDIFNFHCIIGLFAAFSYFINLHIILILVFSFYPVFFFMSNHVFHKQLIFLHSIEIDFYFS